jgi:hypothetical protein
MYFFSNSPVKWRLTKVVCREVVSDVFLQELCLSRGRPHTPGCDRKSSRIWQAYLSGTTVTDKHELEGRDAALLGSLGHGEVCCGGVCGCVCCIAQILWEVEC